MMLTKRSTFAQVSHRYCLARSGDGFSSIPRVDIFGDHLPAVFLARNRIHVVKALATRCQQFATLLSQLCQSSAVQRRT